MAITLRIVLVENLRRSAERIVSGRAARQQADALADRLLGVGGREAEPAEAVLKGFDSDAVAAGLRGAAGPAPARSGSEGDAGAVLAGPAAAGAGNDRRRERARGASGAGRDERDRAQRDHEHAPHVRGRLGGVFRERQPGRCGAARRTATSPRWTFPTRDRYRHAIEELARGSGHTEIEVAQRAIAAAKRAAPEGPGRDAATVRREQDPGYYLISRGRKRSSRRLGFRAPMREWLARANAAAGILGLSRNDRVDQRDHRSPRVARARASPASADGRCFVLGDSRAAVPAIGRGGGAGEPRVTDLYRPDAAARPGASRRSAGEPAHDGRRAHAADDTRRKSRSRSSAWRFIIWRVRTATSASRCSRTGPIPRLRLRRATTSFWAPPPTAIARLNQRHGPAPDGERFLLLHRRRVWNAGAGKVDRMGAQARQAARAESLASRRDRHDLRRNRRPARRSCPPASAT